MFCFVVVTTNGGCTNQFNVSYIGRTG